MNQNVIPTLYNIKLNYRDIPQKNVDQDEKKQPDMVASPKFCYPDQQLQLFPNAKIDFLAYFLIFSS